MYGDVFVFVEMKQISTARSVRWAPGPAKGQLTWGERERLPACRMAPCLLRATTWQQCLSSCFRRLPHNKSHQHIRWWAFSFVSAILFLGHGSILWKWIVRNSGRYFKCTVLLWCCYSWCGYGPSRLWHSTHWLPSDSSWQVADRLTGCSLLLLGVPTFKRVCLFQLFSDFNV